MIDKPKYIYTKRNKYSQTRLEKFEFVKETATQIVAKRIQSSGDLIRFDKKTGREKGVDSYGTPKFAIPFKEYKEIHNKQLNQEIDKLVKCNEANDRAILELESQKIFEE